MAAGLARFGVNPRVLPQATAYIRILNWGTLPLMLYFAFRRYLQGIGLVQPVMFAVVIRERREPVRELGADLRPSGLSRHGHGRIGLGHLRRARLYGGGAGLPARFTTTASARAGLFHVSLGAGLAAPGPAAEPRHSRGHAGALEIGVFALATALIARLDAASLAGHQIALNMASLTFMVPLGISSAAAVRVGHLIGQRDPAAAGRAGWSALACGVAFMSLAAVAFLAIPAPIARIYTADPAVIRMSVTLLAIAAAFQIVRRVPGGGGGRLARNRQHAHADVVQPAVLLVRGPAAGDVAVLPRRMGRGRALDGPVLRAHFDRIGAAGRVAPDRGGPGT